MRKAWIDPENTIRDVAPIGVDPFTIYAPVVAAFYSEDVPDEVQNGWVRDPETGVWSAPQLKEAE